EAALAKSERDFRSLAENTPDNIARWDAAGRILYSNPTHQRTLGKPNGELIGKTHGALFPDGRTAAFDEALERIVATGEATTLMRVPVPGENCDTRLHDIKLVPEFDADGKVVSVLGLGRDMTEIYRMQEAVAAREAEYRALAENSPDPIIRYDLSGRRLYANAMAFRMTSLPHDKLVGGLPQRTERLSQADVEKVRRCLEATAQTGQPSGCEVDFHMPDGSHRVYQSNYVPELGADGKVASILGVSRDITAIREAEHRLRHLIDNLPGYVYTASLAPEGRLSVPYISAACEEVYGLRPDEVKNDPGAIQALLHPDDLPCIEAALDGSARNLTPFRAEYRVCRPGHAERWLEARAQPMRRADGTIVWHSMALDITERKRSQDALAAREQEFRSLAESSPDFIIRYDLEHRILYLNAGLARELKLASAEEVIGRRPIEVWPDGRFSAIDEAARRVLASGAEETIEMPYESCTGEAANGQIAIVPERNVDGAIIGILAFGRNITDLKHANELLAHAQAIARLGSWDWDIVADRVEWSEMTFEIYTPDARPAAPGFEDFKRAVHPDDLERVVAAVTAAFEQDAPFDLDHRVVSRSKGVRTVHAQGKVFRAADGTPVRMVGTVQDITERKKAQQRMELLERAVDHSSDAIWLVAPDLSIRYVNDTACNMLGYSREELLRMTSPDIDADITREDAANMVDMALSGEPIRFESRHRAKDGRIFPVEISGTLIEDRGEYFSLVGIRDITERKRAEQELIARERGYRTLLETVPDLIVRYDLELRRIYVNPAWEKASGLSAKEVINTPYSDIPKVSRPFQDEYVKKLRQVLATGVPQTAESTWITASGEKLLLEYAIMPEDDHRGRISGVLAVGRDITERKKLEEQLRQHQRMEAIGQ
ncbi:MAG: PAS domain S-box protein, partial [Candidatus Odinarchaeota archaeon]